jgi:hypothetical protein
MKLAMPSTAGSLSGRISVLGVSQDRYTKELMTAIPFAAAGALNFGRTSMVE